MLVASLKSKWLPWSLALLQALQELIQVVLSNS